VILPKPLQFHVVQLIHERGHLNVAKTEALIRKQYWFKGITQVVEKVVHTCGECRYPEEERKRRQQLGLLSPIENIELPFDTYHINHLGPLPITRRNHQYILVVIDDFSKYIWLYPATSTSSAEVISRLKKQSVNFGNPRTVVSDCTPTFTSQEFNDYINQENIDHIWTDNGIPGANDQVDRVNRRLIPLVKKLCAATPDEWYKYLDRIQKYLNATPTRSTNVTPFQLMFGTRIRLTDDMRMWRLIEDKWARMFQEESSLAQAEARRTLNESRNDNWWF
jgi:hypothetical protein